MTVPDGAGDPATTIPLPRLDLRMRNTGEAILLGWREVFIELTDSAVDLWRLVDGHRSVAEIGALIAEEYGIEVAEAVADVGETLSVLAEARFVRLASTTDGPFSRIW